jgi:hypothetical protein
MFIKKINLNKDVLIMLVEKYNSTVDLIERIINPMASCLNANTAYYVI